MSPRPAHEVVRDEPDPDGPEREDGSAELDRRAAFAVLFDDPAVRNYSIAALSALAVIFLVLFQNGSDLGGLLVLAAGAAGVLLRWTAAPGFVILLLTYFMVFPSGIPGEGLENRREIEEGWFRPQDVLLAAAVLVYAACQFRIYGFVRHAVAFEGAVRRPDEPAARRPPALISPGELGVLLGASAAAVVAGQLVWWLANAVEVAPGADFPLRWVGAGRSLRRDEPRNGLPPGMTRFVVLVGLLFAGVLLARLVFGYWRLRAMGPAEGAMVLQDGGWAETKRERSRLERWRFWGRKQAEAAAEAAVKAADTRGGKR